MAKIKFLTDSAADIPAEQLAGLDIQVLPFPIIMGDKEYADGVDFTAQEFYAMLEQTETIPTHSQITAFQFAELYAQLLEQGYTDIIYTSINAKGSATYSNAVQAKTLLLEDHPEAEGMLNIYVIDSKCYTYAYGYAVVQGAKLAQAGKSVEEIVAYIQDWVDHVRILFAPYNLRFAKKSGRVPAAAAFLGDALGLKPIMTFPNGNSETLSKARGEKNLIPAILKIMKEEIEDGSPYFVIDAEKEDKNLAMQQAAEAAMGRPCDVHYYIGGVIAINGGPNLTGVIYRKKGEA